MVRPLAPFRQHCPACNWDGPVVTGHSDAIIVSDLFSDIRETCPKCGKGDLEFGAISELAATSLRVIDIVKSFITDTKSKK